MSSLYGHGAESLTTELATELATEPATEPATKPAATERGVVFLHGRMRGHGGSFGLVENDYHNREFYN
jgi:hypothetical protein